MNKEEFFRQFTAHISMVAKDCIESENMESWKQDVIRRIEDNDCPFQFDCQHCKFWGRCPPSTKCLDYSNDASYYYNKYWKSVYRTMIEIVKEVI